MPRATRKSITRPTGARRSITALFKDFGKAHAAAEAVPSPKPPSVSSKEFDRAVSKCGRIADRIVKAPANSCDEMLLKIVIAGWCVGAGNNLAQLDHWKPTKLAQGEELDALVSLRDDLRRLSTKAQRPPKAGSVCAP